MKYVARAHRVARLRVRRVLLRRRRRRRFPIPSPSFRVWLRSDAVATADPHSLAVFGFAQDDWILAPRVTLDIGLRYDVERISNLRSLRRADGHEQSAAASWRGVGRDSRPHRGARRRRPLHAAAVCWATSTRCSSRALTARAILYLAPGARLMPTYPNILSPSDSRACRLATSRSSISSFRNPVFDAGDDRCRADALRHDRRRRFRCYLRGFDLMSLVDTNAPASMHEARVENGGGGRRHASDHAGAERIPEDHRARERGRKLVSRPADQSRQVRRDAVQTMGSYTLRHDRRTWPTTCFPKTAGIWTRKRAAPTTISGTISRSG